MTQLEFIGRLDGTEIAPGVFLVSARGPLDGRIAAELRDLLLPVAGAEGGMVTLDLTEAHGFDEETCAVVAQAAHIARARGGRLAIVTRSRAIAEQVEELRRDGSVSLHFSLRSVIDHE